ncbi:SDR family oxidoreductase [Undibacter mobilis]|uniref:SDR family NAD(P)-dependent oxidoreductase n=1 Tax=Undibacter mobilis TaxID=2292256 RepID=A0A371B3S4_9BRAD|nr:SDR family oxidoreductase [Undibacter mobilis]RDV02245.1 SDR family NAD(P)-dependent oxidoreductase [Undibacter mobilis]
MLEGRCALVTGSIGGLGYAIAQALAEAGASIVLNALADRATGDAAAHRLSSDTGRNVVFDGADLTDVAAIERMFGNAQARFGTVDIVVNNAVVRHFSPVDQFRTEDWDRSMAVNVSAAFHCIRLAVPGMRAKGWGRIINMSSIFGARGAENRIDYVTSKTALLGMTRAVAIETALTGITCNAISPGAVPTPALLARVHEQAAGEGIIAAEAERRYAAARHPTERFVNPANVGVLAVFLCSPAAKDITGATLPMDGGWQAR